MKIKDHLLWQDNNKRFPYHPTPNKGKSYKPLFAILHYTAVTSAQSTVNWFVKKEAKASAHLLVDRDGGIYQFAPFNIVTWHAGQSSWYGISGLNNHAIGIELVNGGKLLKSETSGWICPMDRKRVAEEDVVLATHKNESTVAGWHEYTDIQISTAVQVVALLAEKYKLEDVLGHDDISPFRKIDPGPAFPMSSFRSRVFGRKDDHYDTFRTTAVVNIRAGAGMGFNLLSDPLPQNTVVRILKNSGNWSFVEVVEPVNNINDLEGWVYSKYLSAT